MSIKPERKEVSPGVFKTVYTVKAEAINKYTGLRVQKKRNNVPSYQKAERIYRQIWNECREERPDGLNIDRWGELVERYLENIEKKVRSDTNPLGFSPHKIRCKRSMLKHVAPWADKHLDLVTAQFVLDELDEFECQGLSRSLTNHILKEVKCVLGFGLGVGAVKANPLAGIKGRRIAKKRKEALTHEEVERLLHEAKRRSHPYYEIWLLTIALGLRRSELAGLKWLDVDFDQGLIYLRRQWIPREGLVDLLKNSEDRVVAIPKPILPVLKGMKLKSSSEFVVSVDCHKWREGHQAQVLRDFCRKVGIKEVTHHQLRATHITLALIDGVPLGIVKENVGHAKLSTTDEYFRSAGINMKGQMDGLRLSIPQSEGGVVLPMKTAK